MTETGWNLANVFETIADQIPDALAQQQGDRVVTWREFDRRAEAAIPSADDLGDEFESFLRDQRDDG